MLDTKYRVDVVLNGNEAYQKIKEDFYDVILCDIYLHGMNGIELYEKVNSEQGGLSRNFIFHTGKLSRESKDFFEKNSLEYIEKPASISSIVELINLRMKSVNMSAI